MLKNDKTIFCSKMFTLHLGLNFTNSLSAAFMLVDPKSVKIQLSHKYLFTLLGSTGTKAARRTLMKLSPNRRSCGTRPFFPQFAWKHFKEKTKLTFEFDILKIKERYSHLSLFAGFTFTNDQKNTLFHRYSQFFFTHFTVQG